MTTIIAVVVAVAFILYWRFILSVEVIMPEEVGIKLMLGRPLNRLYSSGSVFVPWTPSLWKGHSLWELVRIPAKVIPFRYEGKEEHNVWSSDRQLLLVQISGYIRFPYNELESIKTMIQSGVPIDKDGLHNWAKDEIIAGLRDIMAGRTMEDAIAKSSLTAVNDAAKVFFLRLDGLFAKSGICGNDPTSFTPGTGEVILRVDQVNPTVEVQKAMQAPVAAKFKADAAKETARMNAEQIGNQVLGTVARRHGMKLEELEAALKADPKKISRPVKRGGYAETFAWAEEQVRRDRAASGGDFKDIRIGGTNGEHLDGQLPGLAGLAVLLGSRGGGGGKGGGRETDDKGFEDELRADLKNEK